MADQRVIVETNLSDPTTPSQRAAVSAGGAVSVSLTASSATVTVDTELPAAAALTDNFANPTAPGVGAFGMLWDSATWDRAPGTSVDGALVNLGTNNDVTVTSGTVSITGAVDTELPAAAALTDNFANPTAPAVGAFTMVWDGATWDRAPGNILSGQFIQGDIAHDSPVNATTNPLLLGGRAQAAAPTAVSLDGDAVRAWFLLNGAQATVITAAGNLIGGDVANGLDVDVTRVTGTVTVDSELPAAAALTDNFATPTAPAVGAFAMVYDGATWDFLRGTAVDGALVNLGANNDVTVTGAVDTELPAAAALTDAFANPTAPAVGAFMMGWNGATWDKVDTANTGRLQVDVVTGGGTDTPTNPVNSWDTTAAVAAGATDNHDHTDVGGTT
jgi:hypothetical protein